jgi:hypothetical protein
MPAKSTSTLPAHRLSGPPGPVPDPASLTSDRRHAVWAGIGEGLLQHCPEPEAFRVSTDACIASIQLRRAEHVHAWAAFLGLPTPVTRTQIPAADPTYQLTITTTTGVLDGVRWFLDHYHRDPLGSEGTTAAAVGGTGE